jgi:TDG/mug DNA glycosylase family protein
MMHRVPDVLAKDLDVLFVGFNPSLVSWETGHHYANPVNNFYRLLYQSGLTPRLIKPEEDGTLTRYGIGLTNLVVDIPSPNESAVSGATYRAARAALTRKIKRYRPRLVVFNGIGVFAYYFGYRPKKLGLQPERIAESRVFITPSSSGAANGYIKERRRLYAQIKWLVRGELGLW